MTQNERLEKLFEDFKASIFKEFGEMEPVKKFVPPSCDEVCKYFVTNGYVEHQGYKAWQYYDTAKWKDSKGKQVKNWKQKMQGVWFRDEFKIPVVKLKDTTNTW